MYPASVAFQNKIKELDRIFEAVVEIDYADGTLVLYDEDLGLGSIQMTDTTISNDNFGIGSAVAADLGLTLINKDDRWSTLKFNGAEVRPYIGLLLDDNNVEYVPLGVFNVDEVGRPSSTIKLKAVDNMVKFDKPYSKSMLAYPATLYQIYQDACSVCGVLPATASFLNDNYIVQLRPEGDITFRDVIGYIAQLSGSYARIDRTGKLEFSWYDTSSTYTLNPENRFSFIPDDNEVSITGVMANINGTTYLAGLEDYVIDISENPLLQGEYENTLSSIYSKISQVKFYPYTSDWQGNPAVQSGDVVTQIDIKGKEYKTIITKSIYKYRGKSSISAQGAPEVSNGYQGSISKKMANLLNRIREDRQQIDIDLSDLEKQILQATQMIAGSLGGYAFKVDGVYYVADNEDLNLAKKVWRWGIGGFGYSSNGVAGPYTTSITADGSIVAMLISANLITADMIKTGILTSLDGKITLNLNDGRLETVTTGGNCIIKGNDITINYKDPTSGKIVSSMNLTGDAISGDQKATMLISFKSPQGVVNSFIKQVFDYDTNGVPTTVEPLTLGGSHGVAIDNTLYIFDKIVFGDLMIQKKTESGNEGIDFIFL